MATQLASIGFLLTLFAGAAQNHSAQEGSAPNQAQAPATDRCVSSRPSLPIAKDPKLPTLYLVGDSTVRNGNGDGKEQWGWGEPLVDDFDLAKINLVNRTIGGRSRRTYITEGSWDEVVGCSSLGTLCFSNLAITIRDRSMTRVVHAGRFRAWVMRVKRSTPRS